VGAGRYLFRTWVLVTYLSCREKGVAIEALAVEQANADG